MAAIGDSIKQKIDEIKESQWLKNKKVIYGLAIGSTAIAIAFTIGMTRNNSYQVSINDEVIGVMQTKEEVATIVDEVVKEKESNAKADITINEMVTVEHVNSKKDELMSSKDLSEKLSKKLSYQKRAIKISIDDKTEVVVATQEEAEEILANVAKGQLPEGAEVELSFTVPEDEETKPEVEKQTEGEEAKPEVEKQIEGEEARPEAEKQAEGEEAKPEVEKQTEGEEAKPEVEKQMEGEEVKPEVANIGEVVKVAPQADGEEEKSEVSSKNDAIPQENIILAPTGKQEDTKSNVVNIKGVTVAGKDYELESTENVKRQVQVFDFYQQVVIEEVYVDEAEIKDRESALNTLLSNTDEVIYYEMEEGDNIWDLAIANGTTMDRILAINPSITDVNRMQIGEVIKLEAPDPVLSMITTQQATFKELIPSEIEYVEFSDLYKDETKIYQEGYDGLKEITVLVHKVNGKEIARDLLTEELIKEPKTKVIAFGTKPKPVSKSPTKPSMGSAGGSVSSSSGRFMHPLNGKGSISSPYGSRWGSFHRGIDIAAPAGTPIYASSSGTVTYSGFNKGGFGKLVIIDHGNGYETYYAHNNSLYVNVGQYVNKGQNIAAVGSTGNSTGNHVHFEIRKNGSPINPYGYIY